MWGRLGAMVRKEFSQLVRDVPIMFILLWAFTGAVYSAGHAISREVKNYPVVIFDLSRSAESRELVSRLRPPSFKIVALAESDAEVTSFLDAGTASLAVVIPPDFHRLVQERQGRFQVISDGTYGMTATIAGAHIARIAGDYNLELFARQTAGSVTVDQIPQVDARIRVAYNPNLTNAWFSSLLEMLNITTMVSMLLTAAAMLREKTYGTLDQLLVSPLRPAELFVAKILPTLVMVPLFSALSLFAIVHGVFGTPIRGSIPLFYAISLLYVFVTASFGLAVAMLARNIAQAMMMLLLILFPMLFLSGAFTPPESMAPWMQYASLISPMRYYIDFGYQVLFKGNGLRYVWHDIVGMVILGAVMFGVAVWRFRRLFHS